MPGGELHLAVPRFPPAEEVRVVGGKAAGTALGRAARALQAAQRMVRLKHKTYVHPSWLAIRDAVTAPFTLAYHRCHSLGILHWRVPDQTAVAFAHVQQVAGRGAAPGGGGGGMWVAANPRGTTFDDIARWNKEQQARVSRRAGSGVAGGWGSGLGAGVWGQGYWGLEGGKGVSFNHPQ